ncbi:MAG: hypothetical protein PF444_08515, partial [Bacteroidales bacterium]|nr:hypothetical protein [Bacteroidales bacterium]
MEFPLIESLAVKDGVVLNAHWHEERYTHTYREYYGGKPEFGLLEKLELQIPEEGYFKLRIAYNKLTKDINISPYEITPIKTLKVVETNQLDYHLKYANREIINQLSTLRGECDDILIINDG